MAGSVSVVQRGKEGLGQPQLVLSVGGALYVCVGMSGGREMYRSAAASAEDFCTEYVVAERAWEEGAAVHQIQICNSRKI